MKRDFGPAAQLRLEVVLLVLLFSTGCKQITGLGQKDPLLGDCGAYSIVQQEMTHVRFSGVDILVVVDNSKSMAEEQANLAEEFPALIQSLLNPPDSDGDTMPDHVPVDDLHIGVVSTDMGTGGYTVETCSDPVDGDDGVLQHTPNSLVPGCDPEYLSYLSYASEDPDPAKIDDLVKAFGCISVLGTDGCGFEQQLKAAARALEHTNPAGPNAGFLRAESIFTIVFVTDEEDCSVADTHIFDTADSTLGHLNLRCYLHPEMVQGVDQYVNVFGGYRADPDKLVLAFIAGVPQDPACEGSGDDLDGCLDLPQMQERIDETDPTRLAYSCDVDTGVAFPPRRLVQVAQAFGDNALVRSICTDDFQPAIDGLKAKLHDVMDQVQIVRELETSHTADNPCRCEATCEIIEVLDDGRPCPDGKPCVDRDLDDFCDNYLDGSGEEKTMCLIPQAATVMTPCDPLDPPSCGETGISHHLEEDGWYYIGGGWSFEGAVTEEPTIRFQEGTQPADGSSIYLSCWSCAPPTGVEGSGGAIGTACEPAWCPPDETGGACEFQQEEVYLVESEDCGGGGCLVLRFQEGGWLPYCTRRCGVSADGRGCPGGFRCAAVLKGPHVIGLQQDICMCVDEDQLALEPGGYDTERVERCL